MNFLGFAFFFLIAVALLTLGGESIADTPDSSAASPPQPNWVTPKRFEAAAHPRLYVSEAQLKRAVEGRGEAYADVYEQIEAAAKTGLAEAADPMPEVRTHSRQFWMPGRLTAMALMYHRTGDERYIESSVQTIENMESWFEPGGLWQLWHGGFSTAIAISYDLLYNDMTPEQRQRVVSFAREHVIRPFLQRTARGKNMQADGESGSWWQGIISNWNPVCNAGAGMLALSMYDELDEAQTVVDRVNASLDPIIEELQVTEGGWVEGLGYWNWTAHYMSQFYISYERTTGTKHEGFRSPGFRKTLTFVEYFVPYDEACGFGDNQHGGISSSLLAAAEHIGDDDALRRLQYYKRRQAETRDAKQAIRDQRMDAEDAQSEPEANEPVNIMYGTVNSVLYEPESIIDQQPPPTVKPFSHQYPKQGWGAMADQWPRPNAYVAYRAGQLGGAHTQDDLLTWHGIIGNELMVKNIYAGHVIQNSYARRRNELFEVSSRSKNSLFVGSLGPIGSRSGPATANTTVYELPTGPMSHNEATQAFDTTRARPRYVARAFFVIKDRGILVLDRVISPVGGGQPVEVRTYTPRKATFGETDVLLEGEFQTARMTFASNVDATLSRHAALMTFPSPDPPTLMRWQTNGYEASTVMASLLSRGADAVDLSVTVDEEADAVTVRVKGEGWSEKIELTSQLKPVEK